MKPISFKDPIKIKVITEIEFVVLKLQNLERENEAWEDTKSGTFRTVYDSKTSLKYHDPNLVVRYRKTTVTGLILASLHVCRRNDDTEWWL